MQHMYFELSLRGKVTREESFIVSNPCFPGEIRLPVLPGYSVDGAILGI